MYQKSRLLTVLRPKHTKQMYLKRFVICHTSQNRRDETKEDMEKDRKMEEKSCFVLISELQGYSFCP